VPTAKTAKKKFARARRKTEAQLKDWEKIVEREAKDVVRYVNDEVVPTVRTHSSRALRVASKKLMKLAAYMDSKGKAWS